MEGGPGSHGRDCRNCRLTAKRRTDGRWALAIALLAPNAQGGVPDERAHYYYFNQPRPLVVDSTRIAVRSLNSDGDADALPMPGWSVREAEPVSDARLAVEGAAANDGVEFAAPVFVSDGGGWFFPTQDLLVGFHDHVSAEAREQVLHSFADVATVDREWGGMRGAFRLRHASRSGWEVLATANALAQRPEARFAEPDMIFTGRGGLIPNDEHFVLQWGLHNVGQDSGTIDADVDAPEAWDLTIGNGGIVVVIIDTGVQLDHPDLNVMPGVDSTSDGPGDGSPVNVFDNHGTAVAGVISARINNALGGAGLAPLCRSAPARTFIAQNSAGAWMSQVSWTVESLAWAQSIGARITNNSNAYGFTSSAIAEKYTQTRDAGMIHFASVHNNTSPQITYPAILPSVNALAALNRFGERAEWSNFGPGLDFSAPGEEIISTDRTGQAGYVFGDYLEGDGTTFASPFAAATAALVLSRNPGLNAQLVEQIMQDSCVDLGPPGYDIEYGWGFINAHKALLLGAAQASGACCVGGQCVGPMTALDCQAVGGGAPGGRWFANRACADVSCPPANTQCLSAAPVPAAGMIEFDNAHLTNLPDPPYACGIENFHDGTLWFRFTATDTSVRINTCHSKAKDSTFTVYDQCEATEALACSEDDAVCAAGEYLGDQCVRNLVVGQEYFLQFSAWSSGDRGSYTLQLQSPCPPASPAMDPTPVLENRSVSLTVPATPDGQTAIAQPTALRLRMMELQNPVPPNAPGFPPSNFSAYEAGSGCADPMGCARWVGPIKLYPESSSSQQATIRAARLQCTPYYTDWSVAGTFFITGAEIMPSSTYEVENVSASCAGNEADCTDVSDPLQITTGRYGDAVAPFNPPSTSAQPDAVDVAGLVNKFKGLPGAPSKTAAQLQPNVVDLNVNVDALDIATCLDAFKGFQYPYSGPCPCPPMVDCDTAPCVNASTCRGGLCVKTCVGGPWDGFHCNNDSHCAGGACGSGFCRDACGRCRP